jgi:hypothetical protein
MNVKVKTKWDGNKVKKPMEEATYKSLNQAAASLRLIAKRSIRKRKKPSPAGTPPSTQTSRLPRSIVFFVDRKRSYAIVGPSYDLIGPAGAAHEQGGMLRGTDYDQRPFMVPAMEKIIPRLPSMWAASFK